MALNMAIKQNSQIVVGVCARKDPRLSPFVRHITDIMNERHGVMAAPLNGLVGKKDDCCPNVVRQEMRKIELHAIVSLGMGEELRVYHNGSNENALYAAGNVAAVLNCAGHKTTLPNNFVINMEGKTLSALSAEIETVFSEFGLPAMGIRKMQSEIMHFRKSCDQTPLDKRFEMALDPFFDLSKQDDHIRFMRAIYKMNEIFAKYDYPMLFVKDISRKFVPALHIELPEKTLALGEKLAGVIDAGVGRLLQSVKN